MQGPHKFLLLHVLACLGQNGRGTEIVDGELVPENLMLYMASLQNNHGHVCGGFLVSEKFVITAAHCAKQNPTMVFLGKHDRQDFKNHFNIQRTHKIKTNDSPNSHDIMLLELSDKANLDSRVQTIHLPASAIELKENQMCSVAGWGKTKPDGDFEDKLRMVNVSVIDPNVCKKSQSGLPANVICTSGYGTKKGFCQGDEGGPLVCDGIAVGVASFSIDSNCTNPDAPNVYTKISKYLSWIRKLINPP